uniref:Uncharacterized protein n=1 Tax=Chrysotila carterae TaxID=13221 RepID=A0A7S4F3H7_CHRCT
MLTTALYNTKLTRSHPPQHFDVSMSLPLWVVGGLMGRAALASAYECPGSPAFVHASCKVSVEAHAPCDDVRNEVLSRVKGQYLKWHDPHNNGTYTLTDTGADGSLSLQRVTGNKNKGDGCHPVNSNFEVAELEVSPSFGAGTNKADCLKV